MSSSAKQVMVAFALMALIAVNYWFGPQKVHVISVLYGGAGQDTILAPTTPPAAGPGSTGGGSGGTSGAQPKVYSG